MIDSSDFPSGLGGLCGESTNYVHDRVSLLFPYHKLQFNKRDTHSGNYIYSKSGFRFLNFYHFQRRGTEVISMFFSRLARSVCLLGPSGLFVRSAVEYIEMPGRSSRKSQYFIILFSWQISVDMRHLSLRVLSIPRQQAPSPLFLMVWCCKGVSLMLPAAIHNP